MRKKKKHPDDGKLLKYCKDCFSTEIEHHLESTRVEVWDTDKEEWVLTSETVDVDEFECQECFDDAVEELRIGEPGYVYPGDRKAVLIEEFHWDNWLKGEDGLEYFLEDGCVEELYDEQEIDDGDLVILEKVDHFRWKFVFEKATGVGA